MKEMDMLYFDNGEGSFCASESYYKKFKLLGRPKFKVKVVFLEPFPECLHSSATPSLDLNGLFRCSECGIDMIPTGFVPSKGGVIKTAAPK